MMRKWKDALREHMAAVLVSGVKREQILGFFLYGSQNYMLETENSDIDTKCVVVPDMMNLCLGKPLSREIRLPNGEHCEIKDIRLIVDMFKKQNINFLEILVTDYMWLNPKYEHHWREWFMSNTEDICHYDERKAVLSMTGQALHTLYQIKTTMDAADRGKKYANALRIYWTLVFYLDKAREEDGGKCLHNYKDLIELPVYYAGEDIFKYKQGLTEVKDSQIDELMAKFEELQKQAPSAEPNIRTEDTMKEGIMRIITDGRPWFDFYEGE